MKQGDQGLLSKTLQTSPGRMNVLYPDFRVATEALCGYLPQSHEPLGLIGLQARLGPECRPSSRAGPETEETS